MEDNIITSRPGLLTDITPSLVGQDKYIHARNLSRASHHGDLGTLSNEKSNSLCYTAPYKIWGVILLPNDKHLVFSGDGTMSEIGIADPSNCSYTTLKNLKEFNFIAPIYGVAKTDFRKEIIVTFTDKVNPVRRVELSKISNINNIDEILLFKKITHPTISLKSSTAGTVPNGTYSVAIAYNVDNQIFSDWYSISNRIMLHSINSMNAFEINIDNLDTEFENYSLVVVGNFIDPTTKGATKLAKIIGTYSTKVKRVTVTDFVNGPYETINLSNLVIRKKSWQKAGIISSNSNYLILADLVAREEENYQLKAMSIEAEYVIVQVPIDFYDEGSDEIGYYGDENYDFYIEGIYNTGESTNKYHIPGRKKKASDGVIASTEDVYEFDDPTCPVTRKIEKWEVENTATQITYTNDSFSCGRRVLGYGELGYFQSTELYPDNKEMFGDQANTPIRYHKFPDESIVPRYSIIEGETYINIRAVRFKNIPAFDNPDIVGYKITRSDRKGGNGTVIARGLLSNVRSYKDKQTNQEVLYTNYTVNDLNPDQYLSSTQTSFSKGSEKNFNPLTSYYKDKFNFYSPHIFFEPRYSLGNEIKIESEEVATVTGKFEKVHNHPKLKLLNQFAFWISLAIGFLETKYEAEGLKNNSKGTLSGGLSGSAKTTGGRDGTTTTDFGNVTSNQFLNVQGSSSALALTGASVKALIAELKTQLRKKNLTGIGSYIKALTTTIKLVASLGVTAGYIALSVMRYAQEVLDIIYNFVPGTDYVYQYNAHAKFLKSEKVDLGNRRRSLRYPAKYLPSDVVTLRDKVYNNYFREKSVLVELNKEIQDPKVKDNSRNTISGFGICDNITKTTSSTGSMYYATSKVSNRNQYGTLGSANSVSMHSGTLSGNTTPILFGGDCIIVRWQFLKKMQFFNQNLANANFPDEMEYDYRLYRNIAYPRYWLDSTKYDFTNILNKQVVNYQTFSRTTTGKYNLDCKRGSDGSSIARIDNAYMYLSNNCVIDFIVECDYNPNFREQGKKPFYSKENTNISQIFRSDNLSEPEHFEINRVYSDIYTTEIKSEQQRLNFTEENRIPQNQENAVIYSLPSYNLQEVDNWQYFLPGNYFSFRDSDFGKLTGIHKVDQDRLLFLFSKSSPYISMGRDFLELEGSGRKITIGDGGLFAQDPREIMPTDTDYGNSTSRFAFVNSHLGRFYVSENQGRIIQFGENLDDISRAGISFWCRTFMPIRLYEYFPSYPKEENPINGVGYLSVSDSFLETIYICKRDFSPRYKEITWDGKNFKYNGINVSLRDPKYFNDISWTLSYSPAEKAFISWHDWHPDLTIQTQNHFMTVKDKSVWKHNERHDSFCNFYGVDYPFSITYITSSGKYVHIPRSIEYQLEAYVYKNNGRDRFHKLNENYDRLQVFNSEQASPLLNLSLGNPNPEENVDYPKKASNISYDVTFFKEENKYRINQFWDSTKDRGEFTDAEVHLFATDESGYKRVINPLAINIDKSEEERKKFRHYYNAFQFSKTVSGDVNFLTRLLEIKKTISIK